MIPKVELVRRSSNPGEPVTIDIYQDGVIHHSYTKELCFQCKLEPGESWCYCSICKIELCSMDCLGKHMNDIVEGKAERCRLMRKGTIWEVDK